MKLVFDKEDIEALLIARAASLGIHANKIEWDDRFGLLKGATASFVEPPPSVVVLPDLEDVSEGGLV